MYIKRLRDLREDHDLHQKDVACAINVTRRAYSFYETGKRQLPLEVLVSLAKFYNTSTDYILGITDVKEEYPQKKKVKS